MDRVTDEVLSTYEALSSEHGVGSVQALGWSSEEAQKLRFNVIVDEMEHEGWKNSSLLDVGCGIGELVNVPGFANVVGSYYGVDFLASNIERADVRFNKAGNVRFKHWDWFGDSYIPLEMSGVSEWDVVVCSGMFHHYTSGHVYKGVKRMWEVCKDMMVFNVMVPGSLVIMAEVGSILDSLDVKKWRMVRDYDEREVTVVGLK